MSEGAEGGPGLHVLAKAEAIIDAIAQTDWVTAAALAEQLQEPVSSIYRLLASLSTLRWVERGERRGKYRLGTRFTWLGGRFEMQLELRGLALPSLRSMNAATHQTAFLCVRNDVTATCIERIDGQDVQIQRLRLGGALPLHEGATPRVLLAHAPTSFIQTYLEAAVTAQASERLRDELAGIRRDGYVIADDEIAVGIRSVGAPIFGHSGEIVAAISVSGLRDRGVIDSDGTVALVRGEAARVSALLGYRDASTAGILAGV